MALQGEIDLSAIGRETMFVFDDGIIPLLRAHDQPRYPAAVAWALVRSGPELHDVVWESMPTDARPERFELRRPFLLEHLRRGDRVLDIGCGAGEFAVELLRDAAGRR